MGERRWALRPLLFLFMNLRKKGAFRCLSMGVEGHLTDKGRGRSAGGLLHEGAKSLLASHGRLGSHSARNLDRKLRSNQGRGGGGG